MGAGAGEPFGQPLNFQIYLPIAEVSVNLFHILGAGLAVGFWSGLLGVGGGFLITPLLILLGIPPLVAVSTGANQSVATSVSGALAQWRRGNVDLKMGGVLLAGGVFGTVLGVRLVYTLRQLGQFDLAVAVTYVVLLGTIGLLMLIESIGAIRQSYAGKNTSVRPPGQHHAWLHGLPYKMRFNRSKLYVSALPPAVIGAFVGLLSGVMGVGGGFVLVPALVYLIRMRTTIAMGTSQMFIVFGSGLTTILQAYQNESVDVLLAMMLMVGGVIGAQIGAAVGQKFNGEQLRAALAVLVLMVCFRVAFDLLVTPSDLFSIAVMMGGR